GRTSAPPAAPAGNVKCRILWPSATNDFHGRMDLAYRTLDRVPAEVKGQVFTANYDHHVEPAEARSLPLFMNIHLKGEGGPWPATPRVEIASGGDVPVIRIAPEDAERVERVDVYYCLNNDFPTARFWRTATGVRREKDGFAAPAPFLAATDVLYAFASVTYRSGVRLRSRLATRPVSELAGVKPTLERPTLVDAEDTARDWDRVTATNDPNREDRFFADWAGPAGEHGFTLDPKTFNRAGPMVFYFGTRKVGDPQYRGTGRKALLLDHLAAHAPDKVTVRLSHRLPGQNPTEFPAALPAAPRGAPGRAWGGGGRRGGCGGRGEGPSPGGTRGGGSGGTGGARRTARRCSSNSGGPTDRNALDRHGTNLLPAGLRSPR